LLLKRLSGLADIVGAAAWGPYGYGPLGVVRL
jgi:hypothetical protein